MRKALKAFERAMARDDTSGLVSSTADFYAIMLNGCGNGIIAELLAGLNARIGVLRARSMSRPGRARHSLGEMTAMLERLENGDAKGARAAIHTHVSAAAAAARESFEQLAQPIRIGYLPKLKKSFCFKPNYQSEIAQATELGWFLARFGEGLNPALQAKRILWCVRTILIARSAELREPVFAPQLLAERTKSEAARELLSKRHDRRDGAALRHSLRLFLRQETKLEPFHQHAGRTAFARRFKETSNKVALQTLRQEESSRTGYE
jgi:hypothetical protein